MNIGTTIRRYPVAAFITLTFAVSLAVTFAPVGGDDQFVVLAALVVPIPTIVALALSSVTDGVRFFLGKALNWRLDLRWVLIALGIGLGVRLLVSILALFAGAIPAIEVSAAAPALVVVTILFALLEEIGWRGFAVRRLVMHRSPMFALLVTGIPWSIIHIFFYLNQGADAATLAQVFAVNFALTVMVTWIYLRSGRQLWPAVILHGAQTVFSIVTGNIAPDQFNQYWITSYCLIALLILAADWRIWVARGEANPAADAPPVA